MNTPPACLNLIDDCWYNIFDFLSVSDIVQMSTICKHLLRISGNYLCKNCLKLEFDVEENKITYLEKGVKTVELDFYPYIQKLRFYEHSFRRSYERKNLFLRETLTIINFDSLRKLKFWGVRLYQSEFSSITQVLIKIESIQIGWCKIFCTNIFTTIANHAPKLKKLSVKESRYGEKLFCENYKSLECLKYKSYSLDDDIEMNNLKSFFERHTKLKRFYTDYFLLFFWTEKDKLSETFINFDILGISFQQDKITLEPFVDFCKKLAELHQTGFYKYLSARINFPYMNYLPLMNAPIINLSREITIKELYIRRIKKSDFNFFDYELKELEHLTINSIDDASEILEFVRYVKPLKSIRIKYMNKNIFLLIFFH